MKKVKGFSTIEVLLSAALITMLIGLSIPVYQSFQFKNELSQAVNITARVTRTAQLQSQASDGDSTWGVRVQNTQITLFKGADYATRDMNYDVNYTISRNISVSGVNEIVFSKLLGEPNTTGNMVFSRTGDSKTININAKGRLSY